MLAVAHARYMSNDRLPKPGDRHRRLTILETSEAQRCLVGENADLRVEDEQLRAKIGRTRQLFELRDAKAPHWTGTRNSAS